MGKCQVGLANRFDGLIDSHFPEKDYPGIGLDKRTEFEEIV